MLPMQQQPQVELDASDTEGAALAAVGGDGGGGHDATETGTGTGTETAAARRATACREGAKMFALGQVIAFLTGCTGLFAQLLASNGVDMPTTQVALNYLCISFALVVHAARNGWRLRLSSPWWAYAVLAFFDLEANYAVTKAYQCTDITSIQLLDCMTIPTCFVLSKLFLRAQFRGIHYVGIVLCLVGIALIVVSDTLFAQPAFFGDMTLQMQEPTSDGVTAATTADGTTVSISPAPAALQSSSSVAAVVTTAGPANASSATTGGAVPALPGFCLDSRLVGDALCLAGSIMYGVANVAQESIVKEKPIAEFLGMLGAFGFPMAVVQIAVLERQELASMDWLQLDNLLYILGFGASLTLMYVLTSLFLRLADSTFFNISLLFADFWAVVVSWLLFHVLPQWLYFVAVPFVVSGCVVYSLRKVVFLPRAAGAAAGGGAGGGTTLVAADVTAAAFASANSCSSGHTSTSVRCAGRAGRAAPYQSLATSAAPAPHSGGAAVPGAPSAPASAPTGSRRPRRRAVVEAAAGCGSGSGSGSGSDADERLLLGAERGEAARPLTMLSSSAAASPASSLSSSSPPSAASGPSSRSSGSDGGGRDTFRRM